jgi:hypothetical protein
VVVCAPGLMAQVRPPNFRQGGLLHQSPGHRINNLYVKSNI